RRRCRARVHRRARRRCRPRTSRSPTASLRRRRRSRRCPTSSSPACSSPAPQPQPPVVQKVEPPPVETPSKPEAPAPVLEEVIVDSVPPGAKIWVDGAPFADTPETVKVEKGKTRTVVLKKDGFVDQEQTVDPDKSHKLLVHLERVKKAVVAQKEKPGKAVKGKLPVPPPASIDPPAKEPKPVVTQHPA